MNKRILAAAIASALLAPLAAHADPAGVTLYGTLNTDIEADGSTSGKTSTGAAAANYPTRARVQSNSSNFGIRGKEDLGDGLYAIFQVESAVPVNGSVAPSATSSLQGNNISSSVGTLGSRNTNLGLNGGFGTVFLGNWDTPYKSSTLPLDINWGAAAAYYYTNILGGGTTSTYGNAVARNSFDRRQENSVQYWSPNFNGLQFKAVYSADSTRPKQGTNYNPALYGFSVVYDDGTLYGSLAYVRHIDYGVSATSTAAPAVPGNSSDYGVKLSVGYNIASTGTNLGLIAERLDYNGSLATPGYWTVNKIVSSTAAAAANEAKVTDYALTVKQAVGAHGTIRASYAWDTGLNLNTGDLQSSAARAYVLGYSYNLSKRTDLYVFGEQVNNDANSTNDLGGGSQLGGLAGGSTVRSLGAGIRHTF